MALSPNINDREMDKFVDVAGATAVRVTVVAGGSGGQETIHQNGTLSGSPINVPTTGTTALSQTLIRCLSGNISASFDGGSTYITIKKDEVLTWEPTPLTQYKLNGTGTYETLSKRSV